MAEKSPNSTNRRVETYAFTAGGVELLETDERLDALLERLEAGETLTPKSNPGWMPNWIVLMS